MRARLLSGRRAAGSIRSSDSRTVGGGVAAVAAAVSAGLAVAALPRPVAPIGSVEVGARFGLPPLPGSDVVLHSGLLDLRAKEALRTIAASYGGEVRAPNTI